LWGKAEPVLQKPFVAHAALPLGNKGLFVIYDR
jgi:hypothetical protein